MPLRSWAHLAAPELARLAHPESVVILPLGAVEQHGPHLPLSTDLDLVLGVLARAGQALASPEDGPPMLVLPPLSAGASLEHAHHPGTLSLSARLLADLVVATGRGVAAAGFRRLVLLNGHGGNHAPLQEAALRLRADAELLVVNLHYPRLGPPEAATEPRLPEAEWVHGLHGGAVETAMMLHLHPERVSRERLPSGPLPSLGPDLARAGSRIGPAGPVPFAWLASDLSPLGIAGDPRLATSELGALLVDHFGLGVAQVLRDTAAFPLERLAAEGGDADGGMPAEGMAP